MGELPTIRWCETHDLPDGWDETMPGWEFGCAKGAWGQHDQSDGSLEWGFDCTIVEQVRLPPDFDERMKAQGLREGIRHADKLRRWVSDWQPVE